MRVSAYLGKTVNTKKRFMKPAKSRRTIDILGPRQGPKAQLARAGTLYTTYLLTVTRTVAEKETPHLLQNGDAHITSAVRRATPLPPMVMTPRPSISMTTSTRD